MRDSVLISPSILSADQIKRRLHLIQNTPQIILPVLIKILHMNPQHLPRLANLGRDLKMIDNADLIPYRCYGRPLHRTSRLEPAW